MNPPSRRSYSSGYSIEKGTPQTRSAERIEKNEEKVEDFFSINSAPARVRNLEARIKDEEKNILPRENRSLDDADSISKSRKKISIGPLFNRRSRRTSEKEEEKPSFELTPLHHESIFYEDNFLPMLDAYLKLFKGKMEEIDSSVSNSSNRHDEDLLKVRQLWKEFCETGDQCYKQERQTDLGVHERTKINAFIRILSEVETNSRARYYLHEVFSPDSQAGEKKCKQFSNDLYRIQERRASILSVLFKYLLIEEQDEMKNPISSLHPWVVLETTSRTKMQNEIIQATYELIEVKNRRGSKKVTPYRKIPPLHMSTTSAGEQERITTGKWFYRLFRAIDSMGYCEKLEVAREKKGLGKEMKSESKGKRVRAQELKSMVDLFFMYGVPPKVSVPKKSNRPSSEQTDKLTKPVLEKQISEINSKIPWYSVLQRLAYIQAANLMEALNCTWPFTKGDQINQLIKLRKTSREYRYVLRFGVSHKFKDLHAKIIIKKPGKADVIQHNVFGFFLRIQELKRTDLENKKDPSGLGQEIVLLKLSETIPHSENRYSIEIKVIDLIALTRFPKTMETHFKVIQKLQRKIILAFKSYQQGQYDLSSGATLRPLWKLNKVHMEAEHVT